MKNNVKKIIAIFIFMFLIIPMNIKAASEAELVKGQNPDGLKINQIKSGTCVYEKTSCSSKDGADVKQPYTGNATITFKEGKASTSGNKVSVNNQSDISVDNFTYSKNDSGTVYCREKTYYSLSQYRNGTGGGGGTSNASDAGKDIGYNYDWAVSSKKVNLNDGTYMSVCTYTLKDATTKKFEKIVKAPSSSNDDDDVDIFGENKNVTYACGKMITENLMIELVKIYRTVCLVMGALVIVLGVMDFTKAIGSDDNDALKKAQARFIKRFVVVLIILMLPILLKFMFTLFGNETMKTCLDRF